MVSLCFVVIFNNTCDGYQVFNALSINACALCTYLSTVRPATSCIGIGCQILHYWGNFSYQIPAKASMNLKELHKLAFWSIVEYLQLEWTHTISKIVQYWTNTLHGSTYNCLISWWKSHCVRNYIEVKFPTIEVEV